MQHLRFHKEHIYSIYTHMYAFRNLMLASLPGSKRHHHGKNKEWQI